MHLVSDFGDIVPLPDAGAARARIRAGARPKVDVSPPARAAPGNKMKADLDGLFAELQEND